MTFSKGEVLKSSWLSYIGLLLLAVNCHAAERPNIVFAIADDWGWPHATVYGNDDVCQTPTFDRIAKGGVLFNHAYVSSPSCTPSRNAILTGKYHWQLGSGANLWSTLDTKHATYPLLLEDAGYHVGSWRKSWGPGNLDNWERHPAGKVYKSPDSFLDDWDRNEPFCFWLGSSDPHRDYELGSGKASGMDLDKIKLFGHFPDNETVRGDVADYYYEVQRFDRDVGEFLKKLEQLGVLENTIVVMTGDHGMPFPRCKSNVYDSGSRVPLAISWPRGIASTGRVLDDFVSTTDLAPTFLELAGMDVPEEMAGRSLQSLLASDRQGRVEPDRDHVLTGKERHVMAQESPIRGGTPMRAIRTHEFFAHSQLPSRPLAGGNAKSRAGHHPRRLASRLRQRPHQDFPRGQPGQRRRASAEVRPRLRQAPGVGTIRSTQRPRPTAQRRRLAPVRRHLAQAQQATHHRVARHQRPPRNRQRRRNV